MLAELLQVLAAHPGGRMTCDRAENRAAARGNREQATADRGEREQGYDQAGCQTHAAAEHPAGSRRPFWLLGYLALPVGPALDHRRVIGVDQVLLGMQLLDRLIVGVGVGRVVIN